ncbi:Tyrocidine synthase 3 [BD1-7 clade bacterium]|uniref:Tyrocidine synthase 3 n=1 Tax=BD1-7 clade bacterium TaxID=2029982 RepID=A0A5S9MPD6_9GAMM|nr:Tyrocidine synthase 3 [BD1-7 clade bacterium]
MNGEMPDNLTGIENSDTGSTPLSYAQERLLFVEETSNISLGLFNHKILWKVTDPSSIERLTDTLVDVCRRHTALNQCIHFGDDGRYSITHLDNEISIEKREIEKNHWPNDVINEIGKKFHLTQEHPFKIYHFIVGDEHYLIFCAHAMAFDITSLDILLADWVDCYQAMPDEQSTGSSSSDSGFDQYAMWQRSEEAQAEFLPHEAFWRKELQGWETLRLPFDVDRPLTMDYRCARLSQTCDAALCEGVRRLAVELSVSAEVVFLSAYFVLFSVMSGQRDVVVGSAHCGRLDDRFSSTIGGFENALVLRMQIDSGDSVVGFIRSVSDMLDRAKRHGILPFERIIELMNVERDVGRHPIFQTWFEYRNPRNNFHPLPIENCSDIFHSASFSMDLDLKSFIEEKKGVYELVMEYAVGLFDKDTLNRWLLLYQKIISDFCRQSDASLANLEWITAEEIQAFQNTVCDVPATVTHVGLVPEVFTDVAKSHANQVAVIASGCEISYEQLDRRSSELAYCMCAEYRSRFGEELRSGTRVIICLDRNIDLIVAMLAIMKMGGCYVPIGPDYPLDRKMWIFEDTKAPLVITSEVYRGEMLEIAECGSGTCVLDVQQVKLSEPESVAPVGPDAKDLAYVIYTSGTTGRPKGVNMPHGAFFAFLSEVSGWVGIQKPILMSTSAATFDLFELDFAFPLIRGGTLILAEPDEAAQVFTRYRERINLIQQTPSMWKVFLAETDIDAAALKNVTSLFGGEPVSEALIRKLRLYCKKTIEAYGPTECCIYSTATSDESLPARVIGKPLPGESVWILDEYQRVLPRGAVGELYIGGNCLAAGYLNRDELTRERFIEASFLPIRLYKSGDLGRWREDGNLECLGRSDGQIKLNGYRIEPGEIESILVHVEGINQASVQLISRENVSFLVAYIVGQGCDNLSDEQIEKYLRTSLPVYMIPNRFVWMARLPLTGNGKIDKQLLPVIDTVEGSYAPPVTVEENAICGIWQVLLGIEKIGIRDDFFRLGGSSVLAAQMVNRINSRFDLCMRVTTVFLCPTVEALANEVLYLKSFTGHALDELVNPLTPHSDKKPLMFMIHAGLCGAEIYWRLSGVLAQRYSCLGIEHYNAFVEELETDLNELAKIYASVIQRHSRDGEPLTLLGWSLGGNLSMAVARLLIDQGVSVDRVVIIDATYADKETQECLEREDLAMDMHEYFLQVGIHHSAIVEYMDYFNNDMQLAQQANISPVTDVPVLLLKAGDAEPAQNDGHDRYNRFLVSKASSGWDAITGDNLIVRVIDGVTHANIIFSVNTLADLIFESGQDV